MVELKTFVPLSVSDLWGKGDYYIIVQQLEEQASSKNWLQLSLVVTKLNLQQDVFSLIYTDRLKCH